MSPRFRSDCVGGRGVMQGGWGKIDAAASAQDAISRWRPSVVINLGTCGGILVGQIEDLRRYSPSAQWSMTSRSGWATRRRRFIANATTIDLDWLASPRLPSPARRSLLVSADRDLAPADIPLLRRLYRGRSLLIGSQGAIARVVARNETRVLILRFWRPEVFEESSRTIMRHLFDVLPVWIEAAVLSRKPLKRKQVTSRLRSDRKIPGASVTP